jgi:hypothetical protein
MCNFELLHSTCMSGILSLYISLNISYMVFVYAEVRSWWLTFSAWPWEYDLMWFIRILLRHDLSIGVLFIRGRNDINNGFLAILPGHLDNHLRLWWVAFNYDDGMLVVFIILLRHDLSIGVIFIRGRNDINNGILTILLGHLDNHLRLWWIAFDYDDGMLVAFIVVFGDHRQTILRKWLRSASFDYDDGMRVRFIHDGNGMLNTLTNLYVFGCLWPGGLYRFFLCLFDGLCCVRLSFAVSFSTALCLEGIALTWIAGIWHIRITFKDVNDGFTWAFLFRQLFPFFFFLQRLLLGQRFFPNSDVVAVLVCEVKGCVWDFNAS